MAKELLGLPVANALTEQVAERVRALRSCGVEPTLAILRVGERADDLSYERGALKRCEKSGVAVRRYVLGEDCT
jgi:methylenetetrahydrofolate dehydrogenase (NADP+)/methenyltetrahydrofolate cyclohydrolase